MVEIARLSSFVYNGRGKTEARSTVDHNPKQQCIFFLPLLDMLNFSQVPL